MNEHNNTHLNKHNDFSKDVIERDPKFQVADPARISKYKVLEQTVDSQVCVLSLQH